MAARTVWFLLLFTSLSVGAWLGCDAGSSVFSETIPAGVHYDYQADATLAAAFVQLRTQWNSPWELDGGVRFLPCDDVHGLAPRQVG